MNRSASARPSLVYWAAHYPAAFVARALFRVRVRGTEHLPRTASGVVVGGWICAGVPHRNWSEPFLLLALMPALPPMAYVADARTVSGSWWRRAFARLFGGIVPVGRARGESARFRSHLAAASEAIETGRVLAIFPEVGPPSRPPALRQLAPGVAHFARHTGAKVVPVVFGGTDELYLGRRIEISVLPAINAPPTHAGRAEIARWMEAFRETTQTPAAQLHARASARPPRRKRWRWLTGPYPRAG